MILKTTASVAFLLFAGCATARPPTELVNARAAYARVSRGPAAQTVPEEVRKAQLALDVAERSFADQPESPITRDLSYIAERKAQLAEAKGQISLSGKDVARADKQLKQTLSDQKDQATDDAERSRQQATRSEDQRRAEAAEHATAISDEQARTEAEKSARITAETANQALTAELALLGQLREEARGTVITLSGDVIFATNQSALLPSAQTRLDKLAEVLKPTHHRMIIEGHTDSRGSDGRNQELSTQRAGAVRDYLVSRGVAADHIQANGFGKTRPIADNGSAEGRAMNRRVEIIVEGMRTASK
jgi:outer membrane protein OmpA-like peptidoglycan-associated protein